MRLEAFWPWLLKAAWAAVSQDETGVIQSYMRLFSEGVDEGDPALHPSKQLRYGGAN